MTIKRETLAAVDKGGGRIFPCLTGNCINVLIRAITRAQACAWRINLLGLLFCLDPTWPLNLRIPSTPPCTPLWTPPVWCKFKSNQELMSVTLLTCTVVMKHTAKVSLSFKTSIRPHCCHQEIITQLEELSIRLLIFCVGGGRRGRRWYGFMRRGRRRKEFMSWGGIVSWIYFIYNTKKVWDAVFLHSSVNGRIVR